MNLVSLFPHRILLKIERTPHTELYKNVITSLRDHIFVLLTVLPIIVINTTIFRYNTAHKAYLNFISTKFSVVLCRYFQRIFIKLYIYIYIIRYYT